VGHHQTALASWSWTVRLCLILLMNGITQSQPTQLCLILVILVIIGIPTNAVTWMILR
jgi:hypothetical protein